MQYYAYIRREGRHVLAEFPDCPGCQTFGTADDIKLAASLTLRWARSELGLTQTELGKRAGVTQQQIAKLEDPDENPSILTVEKVAKALGLALNVSLTEVLPVQVPKRR